MTRNEKSMRMWILKAQSSKLTAPLLPPWSSVSSKLLSSVSVASVASRRGRWLVSACIITLTMGTIVSGALFSRLPQAHGAYSIGTSLRFDSAGSAYLNRTPGVAGNRQKFTISMWVKRSSLASSPQGLFDAHTDNNNATRFELNDALRVVTVIGGAATYDNQTAAVFRDPAAWMHIVWAYDTTQATAANRLKIYVNNTQFTLTGTFPAQNASLDVNNTVPQIIGRETNPTPTSFYFDGYLSDVYLIDGQQLTPSSFGETDSVTGSWIAKAYSGTYGTTGFHLTFSNSGSLGADSSGNGNNFTVNSLDATDQVIDTPTNNFAVGNSIAPGGGTFSQGNLQNTGNATSTIMMTRGAWYWEVYASGAGVSAGVISATSSATTVSIASGATYGFLYDADNGILYDTTGGSSFTQVATGLTGGRFTYVTGGSTIINYGQSKNATSTATTLTYRSASGGYFLYEPSRSIAAGTTTTFLTSGTSWTVPSDWNSSNNTIEVIGGGGDGVIGSGNNGGGGGGGGAYSKSVNVSLTAGASVTYAVGGIAGDTYFCNSTSNCASIAGTAVVAGAKGGATASAGTGGAGGAAASGVASGTGSIKNSGGTGANGVGTFCNAGGGGGGAAGSTGNGNGGSGTSGGSGDAGAGGAGGAGGNPPSAGSPGTEWDASHGSGGGGGGHVLGCGGGANGGLYGAGGGGGSIGTPGSGQQGIIVVAYATPASTAPSYKALSALNFPTPTIQKPSNYFNAKTYTGNGSTQSITGLNFQPDFVWLKDRTSVNNHGLFDAVRGVQNWIASNLTDAETASTTSLTAFNSGGFSLGASGTLNKNGNSYISWNWKEISTAFFDIVTYTGDNTSNRNISHNLGAAPEFVIVKRRDSTSDWWTWHASLTGATSFVNLDTTAAQTTTNTPWGTGNWSSTQFMVTNNGTNNANASSGTYVAYLFRGVEGFSKFGSYTGNGAADGTFIYTGFKPRFVMLKRTDTTGNWDIWDTARDTYNVAAAELIPNTTAADGSTADLDIVSNGFKLRSTTAAWNASGGAYIYAAFAETPFKYASAAGSWGDPFIFFEF